MRVYFYCADITFTGGIERITTTLANYFVGHGIEVVIVSNFHTNKDFSYPLDSRVKNVFLSEQPYAGSPGSFKRLKKFLENKKNVRSYFKDVHNQIIITQGFPPAFLYSIAMGKRNKNHVINCEHVHYFYYNRLLRILRYFVYKKHNNVCVLTRTDKSHYDKLKIRATCIPNALSLSDCPPDDSVPRNKTILGVGRLEEQKNFSLLLRVFSRVHKKHSDWNLEIYGNGSLKDTLQNEIKKLGISDSAKLMGVSDNISKIMHRSGLFVLSSRFEGFPMVIAEAMANGCPVVSYDCPNGPSDLVADGMNGLLVENQNEEKLYEAVCRMIEEPELRTFCAKNALESVQQYSIENVCSLWSKLFEECGAAYE